MLFSDYRISSELKKAIAELGFKRPTDIQYKSIPNILDGEDLLAIAQTGTGKTAAFAIPVIHKIQEAKAHARRRDGVQALIMVPTRELAVQIEGVFKELTKYAKVDAFSITGGVEQDPQIEQLNTGVDILIATPGRMFDLIAQGHLKLHRVRTLILDEADQMLALGFYQDIQDVLSHLSPKRQSLFFSATINPEIKKLAYSIVKNAIRIQISPKDPVSKNVSHFLARVAMDDKRFFLEQFILDRPESKILVFARTKVRVERVQKAMQRVGIETLILHGGLEQKDRDLMMQKFKNGDCPILIATDVSARGVDIPNVEFVVNYDLPDVAENYVHRIGRTGRGKQKGQAFSFCAPEEQEFLYQIEKFLDQPIPEVEITKNDVQNARNLSNEQSLGQLLNNIEAEEEFARKKKKKRKR